MNQHKDITNLDKRKAEVEKTIKSLTQKREKTLYLYRMEKQSRTRKKDEQQLRTLLEYEAGEIQQAQAGLQRITEKIRALEQEEKQRSNIKIGGAISLIIVLFTFMGLLLHNSNLEKSEPVLAVQEDSWIRIVGKEISAAAHTFTHFLEKYSSGNSGSSLTGAVVGVTLPESDCQQKTICVNETSTVCMNQTIQKCDPPCVNETKPSCTEQCSPTCHTEKINGVEREVCTKTCSQVCTEEVIQNCGSCTDVVEQQCSPRIVQRCSSQKVCSDASDTNNPATGAIIAEPTPIENTENTTLKVPELEAPKKSIEVPAENQSVPVNETYVNVTINPEKKSNVTIQELEEEIAPADLSLLHYHGADVVTNGNFETGDLTGWSTGGNANWVNQIFEVYQGSYAAQAGGIADNEITWINMTVNLPVPGNLTFFWKVSSESGFDFLLFCNSTVSCDRTSGFVDRISGEVAWQKKAYNIPANKTMIFHWLYAKDGSAAAGSDRGWLDNVSVFSNQFPSISSIVLNTTNLSSNNTDVNLTGYTTTTDTEGDSVKVIYNWLVNGSPIATLNMPFEEVNGTQTDNAWDYSGLQNNGSENGGVLWNATGGYDSKGAYQFDGVDDYISLTGSGSSGSLHSACIKGCTINAWVYIKGKSSNPGAVPLVVSRLDSLNNFMFLGTTIDSNQTYFFIYQNRSTNSATCSIQPGTNSIQWDTWQFITGRYNLTHVATFVNGTQAGATACSFTSINETTWENATPFNIGRGALTTSNIFNGTIDEVMIFNRSLSKEQIYALWQNQTNLITAQETIHGENWSVQATPNDGFGDGATSTSSNITILDTQPTVSTIVLNTTNLSTNRTDVNLTVYATTSDADGDSVRVIYNWLVNTTPIALLNMPFEGINGTSTDNAWDYSGFKNNGSDQGGVAWTATGGYDGKGAYTFDGINDYIGLAKSTNPNNISITAWVKFTGGGSGGSEQAVVDYGSMLFTVNFGGNTYNVYPNVGQASIACTLPASSFESSKWYHLGVTYNYKYNSTSANLSCYFNGAMFQSRTHTVTDPTGFSDKNIGRYAGNNRFFNGTIDEVLVFNRTLSNEQMYAIFVNRTDIVAAETLKAENWSVQATPNDGQSDGNLVTSNNVTILDTKPAITAIVLNTTNISANHTDVNLTAYVSTQDNDTMDSVKVIYNWLLNNSPFAVLNMPFEEINGTATNNAWDYSGLLNNGSERGSIVWNSTGGYDGKGAYNFDGIDDAISIPDSAYFKNLCNSGCTFAFWLQKGNNSGGTTMNILTRYNQTGAQRFFQLLSAGGAFGARLTIYQNGSDAPTCLATGSLALGGAWNFVTGRYNGTHVAVFINGTQNAATACTFTSVNQTMWQNSQNVIIGAEGGDGATGTLNWNGTIDDVLIFNRSLSAEQIFALWQNQTNVITKQETTVAENWSVQATPNDGLYDGEPATSTNVTIRNINTMPQITTLVLNTTNLSTNRTDVNLTVYTTTSDVDGNSVRVIYNWIRNTVPIAVVNMPFEGINGTSIDNAWDYSGYRNNGSDVGGVTWNASGGYDGKGAYKFNQTGTRINIANSGSLNFTNLSFSISFWVNRESVQNTGFGTIINKGGATGLKIYILMQSSGALWRWDQFNSGYVMPANEWHHVIYTFNAINDTNGTERFYVDGSLKATRAQATIYASNDQNVLSIGSAAGSHPFNGTIDEMMIFNRSLSAEQVFAIWQNKTDTIVTNETIKAENWSVQATPNDGQLDGNLVTSNNVTILDTKPAITAIVLNTTNMSANHTDVNLTAYVSTQDNDTIDSVKVIYNWRRNNTPIALVNMPFEGINGTTTNNAGDYSGYSHNGSVINAFWNATAGFDSKGAYVFDGDDDYINFQNPSFVNSEKEFTLMAWLYPNETTTQTVHLFSNIANVGNNKVYSQSVTSVVMRINGNSQSYSLSGDMRNKWIHLAFVRNSSNDVVLYENAVKLSTVNTMTAPLNLSTIGTSGAGSWNGTIDEVMFFNRSLSAEQIFAIWQNQTNIIVANETIRNENWSVQATPNDGLYDGEPTTSTNITIQNAVPTTPDLLQPGIANTTTSRTPTFSWNNSKDTIDNEGNITYRLEVDDNSAFNNPEIDVSNIVNTSLTNTSYTTTTELNVDTTFFWRVRGYDGINYTPPSTAQNFTVQSYLAINITNNVVAFGTLNNGANVTTPNSATPFRAENVGNIVGNITITGTSFFNSMHFPSSFYSFKIRANESGAFNTTASSMDWVQMNTTSGIPHVVSLDWRSISNDFLTDINVSVPLNESPGSKSSAITFTMTG